MEREISEGDISFPSASAITIVSCTVSVVRVSSAAPPTKSQQIFERCMTGIFCEGGVAEGMRACVCVCFDVHTHVFIDVHSMYPI